MRLVVELKFGAQPKTVLNQLYKYTALQSSFSIQMLALVNNEPRTLGLRRSLHIYVEHGFMFALGCIQAQSCHTDRCPTGIATQDPVRQRSLVVDDKAERVFRFHDSTLKALAEVVAAAGLDHPSQLAPVHFAKRVAANRIESFAHVWPPLEPGELLAGSEDERFKEAWDLSRADSFAAASRRPNRTPRAGIQLAGD